MHPEQMRHCVSQQRSWFSSADGSLNDSSYAAAERATATDVCGFVYMHGIYTCMCMLWAEMKVSCYHLALPPLPSTPLSCSQWQVHVTR